MDSFWPLSHSSKVDILKEDRHYYIIKKALADSITEAEPDGNDWILYGDEEALLVQPSSCYLRILMILYYRLTVIFNSETSL